MPGQWSLPIKDRNSRQNSSSSEEEAVPDPLGLKVPATNSHVCHELQLSTMEKLHGQSHHQQEPSCPREKSLLLCCSCMGFVSL